jgi:hypothetical protein
LSRCINSLLRLKLQTNYFFGLAGAAGDEVGTDEGFGVGTALGRAGLGRGWLEGALGCGAAVGDLKSGSLPSPAAVAEIEKRQKRNK